MYFKKLELIGFKSFAEKTVIQFEPGVTAIVGPNGCGKSNISDAIRWALGEQSAKSLRGGSMEDVIFNGSSDAEPLNLAEVSLTLSNEAKLLPIDYEEVTITRRLYRSGDSEYLINKNNVRLKDVKELLMGTGIGTESYSTIEQGKMDIILNSKPEERRVIFEEAAGITKYKSKKDEALRKLEQTEANLLRVNDIIQEVKRQIGSVERQAKKAESYKAEFEKLKSLEVASASAEFLVFENQRRAQTAGLEEVRSTENTFLSEVQALDEKCASARASVAAAEESLKAAENEELTAGVEMRRSQDRVLLNRERIGELLERREHLGRQLEEARLRIGALEEEMRVLAADFERAEKEEKEGLVFLASAESGFSAIEGAIRDIFGKEEEIKSALFDCARRKSQAQNELAKVRAEISAIGFRLKKLKQEEEGLLKEVRQAQEKISLPLFEGSARQTPFLARIREFKEKLVALFRAGRDEELDSEIKVFADDVVKIQGQWTYETSQRKHFEEMKQRLEEKLSVVLAEGRGLEGEENLLREKETSGEAAIARIAEEEKSLEAGLSGAKDSGREKAGEKEAHLVRLAQTRSRQEHFAAQREKIQHDVKRLEASRANERHQMVLSEKELSDAAAKKETLEKENAGLEGGLSRLSSGRDDIVRRIENLRRECAASAEGLRELERERNERQKFLNEVREKVHHHEMENARIQFEMDRLKERIFNAYQVDLVVQDLMAQTRGEAEAAMDSKTKIQAQKEKLQKMGPVNLVAIEEYDEMKARYDFLTQQAEDLVRAKDDLHRAITKINRTTRELFKDTFAQVQKHFTEIYRLLFGGGFAELVLADAEDVLESGVEIVARPPGKKLQNISLLSGGEKALTAVALLFALFKVKPSPFCVLDEIDAPLDESNVDRFLNVLKDFLANSQFILITHNKRTMNLADAMYGITMVETGVSRVVSVRFSEGRKASASQDKEEVLV